MTYYDVSIPISQREIDELRVGDTAHVSGVLVTARDAAHKYMVETFVSSGAVPADEQAFYDVLRRYLAQGVIYHCGPIMTQNLDGAWQCVSAGPTTSIREEVYEAEVIAHFGLRGVIGKGGMGTRTLDALRRHGAVYFHAVGGAASLIAHTVRNVLAVYKLQEFGVPEAFWVLHVERLPVVVTMDSHGNSIHDIVEAESREALQRLLAVEC